MILGNSHVSDQNSFPNVGVLKLKSPWVGDPVTASCKVSQFPSNQMSWPFLQTVLFEWIRCLEDTVDISII